jgi:hypothetical protein
MLDQPNMTTHDGHTPADLPERPQRMSRICLRKGRSESLGSSRSNRSEIDVAAFAPFTSCTSVIASPDSLMSCTSTMATQPYTDCSRIAPQPNNTGSLAFRRKPPPSSTRHDFKDPLVERFERLKLPPSGKLQPRPSAPAASPLSPQDRTFMMDSQAPNGRSLNLARATSDEMVTARLFAPMEHVPISQPRNASNVQPQLVTIDRQQAADPIVIDSSDDEDVSTLPRTPIANPFQRHTQVRSRASKQSRQQPKPGPRTSCRRSKNPEIIPIDFTDGSTSTKPRNVSYHDLITRHTKSKGPKSQSTPSTEHRGPSFLGSKEATLLQEYLDQRRGGQSHQRNLADTLVFKAVQHQGTRGDPIDLDSGDPSSDLDEIVFTGRNGGATKSNDTELMDIDEEPWNLASEDRRNTIQSSMDAVLARQLQEEDLRSQRTTMSTRGCIVCGDDDPISEFPSLADCEHVPQTCRSCFSSWVEAQLRGSGWREVKCPESKCKTTLAYYEIQQMVAPEIFLQYDTFIARAAISEDRKF